ncbi:MAG: thioredoxin domain-containing protein [Bacteroidota bacterium]
MRVPFVLFTLLLLLSLCSQQRDMFPMNELSKSTSPYLLQHAKNPVHWKEWSVAALNQAKEQDKPILVSIGYSSCHWCHVMEKESFEDTAVARIMNESFVNIKVDREERPDVDQIYMDAVQTMGLRGGWPLNVFLTPDQKPFYGGTYFARDGWVSLLNSIKEAFEKNRDKINESAEAFTDNLQLNETVKYELNGSDYTLSPYEVESTFGALSKKFDTIDGGMKKSPKFPMPSVWQYLASYYHISENKEALRHFEFTLTKIADGGIYDHIGGGFARYSTDEKWHVPHFEKMLYDNGQLLSLYATGYKITKNPQFKEVIQETISWLKREMLHENGGFYAALDADSEGEEGKFYVWSADEIRENARSNYQWIAAHFDVSEAGNWEGKNAIRIVKTKAEIAKEFGLSIEKIEEGIADFKSKALEEREKRVRPGLDHKIIAGWNGLTLSGLSESFQATLDSSILELATNTATFLKTELVENGKLKRFPNKLMEGFLEDYAAIIQAFIKYYETTLNQEYLEIAYSLLKRVELLFYDEEEGLYYFTSDESQELIARKKELFDNVIPSSNSMMAWNLVHLGTHLYDDSLVNKGKSMLAKVKKLVIQDPEYMGNWALLAMELSQSFAEIVIVGPESKQFVHEINSKHLPNKIITATEEVLEKVPFINKTTLEGKTTIYVCYNKACQRPVTSVKEALNQL